MKTTIKICFAASSGGHFEQIMMLKPLMEKYNCFILTEKTSYKVDMKDKRVYYLLQINRLEKLLFFKIIVNAVYSFYLFLKERPDVVISTGVLAMIPMCILTKIFRRKLIYIESFAKVTTPTETGKLMYKIADQFYVQWPQMKRVFPNAIYLGGIY